jgi:integrase
MGTSIKIDKGIRIYQRGGIWHLAIQRGGDRVRRSLETNDRSLAKAMAKDYKKRLDSGGSISSSHPTLTFADYAEEFLQRKARQLRKGVIANYRTAIRAANPVFDSKPIGSITRSDASRFLEHILFDEQRKCRSQWTINNYITGVQAVFADAADEEPEPGKPLVVRNPFRDRKKLLERVAGEQPTIEEDENGPAVPFSRAEQERFLTTARRSSYPDFVAILVGLRCGLRLSEVCALRWNDVDQDSRTLKVRRRLSRNEIGAPKTRASRGASDTTLALHAPGHERGTRPRAS